MPLRTRNPNGEQYTANAEQRTVKRARQYKRAEQGTGRDTGGKVPRFF
jgi:hypothetical protein